MRPMVNGVASGLIYEEGMSRPTKGGAGEPGARGDSMGRVGRFAWITCAIAVAHGSNLRPAHAEASITDRTQAQLLFNEARSLMSSGKYGEACDKFAESQRLDPGGGTILNLALCHEKQGKTATAWADFNEALSAALRDRRAARAEPAPGDLPAARPLPPPPLLPTPPRPAGPGAPT